MTPALVLVAALAACTSSREEPEPKRYPFRCVDGRESDCFTWAPSCAAYVAVLGGECVERSHAWCFWSDKEGHMTCYINSEGCERRHEREYPGVGLSCMRFDDAAVMERAPDAFPGSAAGLR